jgi:hypothetical protein
MSHASKPFRSLATAGLAIAATAALAGRPLSVDDAGINALGEGHVELWVGRADGATSWNVSPAFAITKSVELSGLVSYVDAPGLRTTGVQTKWMVTPSRDDACNAAASLGALHASSDVGSSNGRYVLAILSCNGTALGNVHMNLGYTKTSSTSGESNWGIALEHPFGALTPHIEVFGSESTSSVLQFGLRGDIARNVQIDGTVGRSDGSTLTTLGLKFRF